MTDLRLKCPYRGEPVVAGSLYCWNFNCEGARSPIGNFTVAEGQLGWTLAGHDHPLAAFAVVLGREGGEQVAIREASVVDGLRPVALDVTTASGQKLRILVAHIIESVLSGKEVVYAKESD